MAGGGVGGEGWVGCRGGESLGMGREGDFARSGGPPETERREDSRFLAW